MAHDVELSGNRYSIGRLSAMQQLHVSRRIAPILPPLIEAYAALGASEVPLTDAVADLAPAFKPFAVALGEMSDETTEYIVGTCLSVVQRQQLPHGWSFVWSQSQNVAMFDDMQMDTILQLVFHVVNANLGDFIRGLLMSQPGGPEPMEAG